MNIRAGLIKTLKNLSAKCALPIRSPIFIGLDIEHDAIHFVQLMLKKRRYQLCEYGSVFPSNHSDIENEGMLAALLQTFSNIPFSKGVVIAVPGSSVMMRTISVETSLREEDIAACVFQQANQFLRSSLQDYVIDFEIVPFAHKANLKIREVRWVAAKRQEIDALVHLICGVGLKVVRIDVDVFALQRAAVYLLSNLAQQDDCVAVIKISNNTVTFCAIKQKKLLYTQEERYLVSLTDLETLSSVLHHVLNIWSRFLASHHNKPNRILVAGTYQQLAHLAEKIEESLNIKTVVADMIRGLNGSTSKSTGSSQENSVFMLSSGLAMRE